MSKRSKSIASIFATRPDAPELSADNSPRAPRVSAGSVRSMKESFSSVERENEVLRRNLADGATIVEVDPALVDPSPVADRFPDEEGEPSFEALKNSIAAKGQEVPVLLRAHPTIAGRYQTAYGHRRVRAARALERMVRAVVRELADDDLVVAQGLENSARQDLTFIERAAFALRLEDGGHGRLVIQQALTIDKAEASKLIAIARDVPVPVVRFVGRAPKIGRGRWQALAEAIRDKDARERVLRVTVDDAVQGRESDRRFAAVLEAARAARPQPPVERSVLARSGRLLASFVKSERDVRLVIPRDLGPAFAEFLAERMPSLYEDYVAAHPQTTPSDRTA